MKESWKQEVSVKVHYLLSQIDQVGVCEAIITPADQDAVILKIRKADNSLVETSISETEWITSPDKEQLVREHLLRALH